MTPSSLDIDVGAYFATTDWNEFQGIRQAMLLQFMQIVESAGTAFAFPTRTVQLLPTGRPAAATAVLAPQIRVRRRRRYAVLSGERGGGPGVQMNGALPSRQLAK